MTKSSPQLAVVTGASGGIGVCFAELILQRGYEVLLVGRSESRLQNVEQELRSRFPERKIDHVAIDLLTEQGPPALFEHANSLGPTSILINNAGCGQVGDFLDQESGIVDDMISTNIGAVTRLCHLFGNHMATQGGGYILNHSSFSALQPPSNYAVYAATKSYVLTLSQALRQCLSDRKVFVTALCSGMFDSGFVQKMGQKENLFLKWLTLDRTRVAKAGINGMLRGKTVVIPSLRYKLMNLIVRLIPRSVSTGVADFALRSTAKKSTPNDR